MSSTAGRVRAFFALLTFLVGCTTSKGFVDYQTLGVYSSDVVGNMAFRDVGPVATSSRSYAWASCDIVATDAVRELLDLAKNRGANTVYKITFDSGNGRVTTPTCTKGWGWFLLYIAGGLGPWVTVTSVEGVAATITGQQKSADMIDLRFEPDTLKLAQEYISRQKL